jgi:FkbM family methyltransferase
MMRNYLNLIRIIIVKIILLLGQKTFLGRGKVRKILIVFINKLLGRGKIEISQFDCTVNNVPFKFYNDDLTGIKFYFGRNENYEINFIKKNSKNNSVFIDIGSNMGLYTQNLAYLINDNRKIKIIAIDANPIACNRLNENLSLLNKKIKKHVKVKNYAIGDKNSIIKLDYSNGLANGVISNKKSKKYFKVPCKKLESIIKEENIKFISNLKIDIEGYEDRALIPFFKNQNKNLFPKNIIIEHSSKNLWKENLINYLNKIGYKKIFKNNANLILSLNTK